MTSHREILALIAARDAQDAFSRAVGWVVEVYHLETREDARTLYGPFSEPAAAMTWAEEFRAGLVEGESEHEAERWRCDVLPIMPAVREEKG